MLSEFCSTHMEGRQNPSILTDIRMSVHVIFQMLILEGRQEYMIG